MNNWPDPFGSSKDKNPMGGFWLTIAVTVVTLGLLWLYTSDTGGQPQPRPSVSTGR